MSTDGPRETTSRIILTQREREILKLLSEDKSRTEMASALFVSEDTLKTHLRKIYKKLGAHNRYTALLRARHEGWI